MKALITAFALLSFVAASSIPVVARADSPTTSTTQTAPKKTKTMHSKKSASKKMTKKKTAAKKTPAKKKTPAA